MLRLLHLCDSLFPIGSFAYSDGLEAATATGAIVDADGLREWLNICLHEGFARLEGPCLQVAHSAILVDDWDTIAGVDAELQAFRPAASVRRSSRAMGQRMLTTWESIYPDIRLARLRHLARDGVIGPTLPISFAAACACAGIRAPEALFGFAYTRLAATISAAMRTMPIGQSEAHAMLADTLARVPAAVGIVAGVVAEGAGPMAFAPAMDIAVMAQPHLHSRLFRS